MGGTWSLSIKPEGFSKMSIHVNSINGENRIVEMLRQCVLKEEDILSFVYG